MIDWPVLFRDVGLGFKAPREAKETNYIDKKCPFTGNISIRGKILNGVILKMKMKRTIVIRRDYLHFVKKYSRCVIKRILFTWQSGFIYLKWSKKQLQVKLFDSCSNCN